MSTSEVDLNDPLNWYIADSMDDYNVRLNPEVAKEIVHRHGGYPKLVNGVGSSAGPQEPVTGARVSQRTWRERHGDSQGSRRGHK